jgi:hypothetical protein
MILIQHPPVVATFPPLSGFRIQLPNKGACNGRMPIAVSKQATTDEWSRANIFRNPKYQLEFLKT